MDALTEKEIRILRLENALHRIMRLMPNVSHGWAVEARKIASTALEQS